MSLSENIKKYRIAKNMTQEQLADALTVSPQAISKWETGATCPDCYLLPAISRVLDVSLDELFDNDVVTPTDTVRRVMETIINAPEDEYFKVARDLTWYMQTALYCRTGELDDKYAHYSNPRFYNNSAYIIDDRGFTMLSNGKEPLFILAPEPAEGYGDFLNEFEGIQRLFATLASPYTSRALIYLMRQKNYFLFEDRFLAKECDIPEDGIGQVIEDLLWLRVITKKEATINCDSIALYDSVPSHKILGLFLAAKEVNYGFGHCLMVERRKKPLLREN